MNVAIINGNLCQDVILKYTNTGKAVIDNTLAVRVNNDKSEFIRVRFWGKTAEILATNCVKGDKITAEGYIKNDSYNKDGVTKYYTYVVANSIYFGFKPKNSNEKEQ